MAESEKRLGCSVQRTPGRKLRFRFRWPLPGENKPYQHSETTALEDTPENRERLRPLCEQIGKQIGSGSFSYLAWFPNGRKAHLYLRAGVDKQKSKEAQADTVRSYYERWIALQAARVAHTTLLGYRSHFTKVGGILAIIGERPLVDLKLDDIEFVRTTMIEESASPKYVKNVLGGSLRGLIRAAVSNGLLERLSLAFAGHGSRSKERIRTRPTRRMRLLTRSVGGNFG
jgi:Arm DNA-binding domain